MKEIMSDKIAAMLFVTAICISALFVDAEIAKMIVSQVVTGIFAVVTGYQMGRRDKGEKDD